MPDPVTRFIALATRPLEGEARELAAVELPARIAHGGGEEDDLREAITRLEPASISPASRWPWSLAVAVAALAVVLAVLLPRHWQEARLLEGIHLQGRDGRLHERVLAAMGPAAADVPLRTFTNFYATDTEEVAALLREDPDDPARIWFSASPRGFVPVFQEFEAFPPEVEKRWKELDPDNALWPLAAAETLASGATIAGTSVVIDHHRSERSLELFRQAARGNQVRPLSGEIRERQLRSFKFDGTLESAHMRIGLLQLSTVRGGVYLGELNLVLLADAERSEKAKDVEGIRALVKDLRNVLVMVSSDREVAESGSLPLSGMKYGRWAGICRRMGLDDDAAWLEKLERIEAEIASGTLAAKPADYFSRRSAIPRYEYAGVVFPAEDHKPGRLAEYAVADRFTALFGVFAAFLVAAAGLIEVLRRGALPRGMAAGLIPLFRASDGMWLFGLGLLFPAAWWFGITWYSPLGCRDIALSFFKRNGFPMMQPWLSQGLGGLVLAFVLMVQTARWRLGKRVGFLALRPRGMWIGWTMAVLAALYIPAMGMVRYLPGHEEKFLLYGSAAGGIALLWLLWQAAMGLCAARGNALGGQVMLRLLMPAVIALALLLLAAMPLLRKSERHWVAEIGDFSRTSRAIPPSAAEQRQLEEARKMLLEALE
jgi:hypothetical protein